MTYRGRQSRGRLGGVVSRACALAVALAGLGAGPAQAQDPGQVGQWGALQNYPIVPVSMGVTPDGKIVAWDQANTPPNFGSIPNNGNAMVLDPQTGNISRSTNVAPRTTFCSLIASLPDGRLAIIGGGVDSGGGASPDIQIYDGESKTFSVAGKMNSPRWYPGGELDRSGNMIVAGGSSQGIERVDQLTGRSTVLDTSFRANWYPDLIRTPQQNFLIEDVGDNAVAGPGRFLLSGSTLSNVSNSSLLQTRRRGIRTMIGPHKLFYNSGGTSKSSMIIDVSSGTPTYTAAANSNFEHMTGQALTLPTGDVLAVGGNSSGDDTKGTPVFTPEIYSPATNTWKSMANSAKRRTYHSVAALMPDGRVWSAGSSFDEVQEPNGAFFSPPYLFKQDGSGQLATRPTATGAPGVVAQNQTFTVGTQNPSNIAYASMVRLAATTHQVSPGQSFTKLPVTARSGAVELTAPSIDQAVPGYYMLFLVDKQGVPSIAPVFRFDATGAAAIKPRVTQSSQYSQSTPASNAFDGDTSGNGEAKISHTLDESQPWWQVDLGQAKDLASVTVNLRTDCCQERTRDLWVFASDTPFQSTTVSGLQGQAGVKAVRMQTPSASSNTVQIERTARYIRIQKPDSGFLHLAEVTPNENRDPSVSVTSPNAGASFTAPASYTFSANASDPDGTVQKVEFYRGSTLVGTDTSAPFSVSDSGVGAGTYSLTAKAFDSNGSATTSSPVSITVTAPNQAPTVQVTSPANGAPYTAPASYTFSANASDDGSIQKVEFFRGGNLVGTDTSSPYSVSESGIGAGTYSLTAKATDNSGLATTSSPVSIVVNAPATGPVAAYAFDEGSGSTLTDKTSNSHNGAISGASWSSGGHSGRALSFDGVDDMVTIADHNRLDLTSAFTIESWVKPRSLNDWRMLLLKEAGSSLSYGLYGNPASAHVGGTGAYAPSALPLNTWSHVATTLGGGTLRVYVNGALVATETGVPNAQPSSGPLRIGGNSIWSFETFDGLIDDVRIYDRTLSASEVATDRDTPVSPPPPSGPSPVLELKFDEGTGTLANDSSGKSHNGTLTNASWSNSGYNGKALDLGGAGMVSVADHADLDLTNTMTLEAYVRPRTAKAWQTVLMKEAPPSTESFALYSSFEQPNANAWVGPNGNVSSAAIPTNAWSHIAFTLENGVGKIYRNGVLVSQASGMGSAVATNAPLRIGGNAIWSNEGFDGLIDEVRVWNVALSASQIAERWPGAVPAARSSAPVKPACLKKRGPAGEHRFAKGKCPKRKKR